MKLLEKIDALIDKNFWHRLSKESSYIREHPLRRIFDDLKGLNKVPMRSSYGYKLAEAIIYINENHSKFFESKWEKILQTNDDYNLAVGTCAEFRCLHILEKSGFTCEHNKENNNSCKPDFNVRDNYGNEIFVEVFTPRIKNSAKLKIENFHNYIEKKELKGKQFRIDMIKYNPFLGDSGESKNILGEISNRLLSNKREAKQAIFGHTNLLWINFEGSNLGIDKKNTFPIISEPFKDIYITGNFGIWNIFYGKKNMKLFKERTWLKSYSGEKTNAQECGYFREGSLWAGVIFNFDKCQVFYQNPWPPKTILSQTKECIVRMEQFDLQSSWIDVNDNNLVKRIDCKIEEINMIHDLLKGELL